MNHLRQLIICLLLTLCLPLSAEQRIISTAGNFSEIVVLLGKEAQLVGVDTTSMRPKNVMNDLPKIGYRRQLSAEGILSLNPTLILLAPDAGPENVIEQLKGAQPTIIEIEERQTLESIRQNITQIADAIDADPSALIAKFLQDEEQLQKTLAQYPNTKKALVLLDTGTQGIYGLGKNSAGDHLLKILHLENAFQEEGHKPFSHEAIATTQAPIILIARRDEAEQDFIIQKLNELPDNLNIIQASPAWQNNCVFSINILSGLGFGANTAKDALEIVKTIQHCL